jgi:hypothetical protein
VRSVSVLAPSVVLRSFVFRIAVVCKATTVRSEVAKKVAMLSTLPATLAAHPAFALVREAQSSWEHIVDIAL